MLSLTNREWYAFVINNAERLIKDFVKAVSDKLLHEITQQPKVINGEFMFPREYIMAYDTSVRSVKEYAKNVYSGYLSSVSGRSKPERDFEKFLEANAAWWYKNGEHNAEFFSVVYANNNTAQKHFYPDYILMDKKGGLWILETKGGETASGVSQDIDIFSAHKFAALKQYGEEQKINIGFVRYDERSGELMLNRTKYVISLNDTSWELLEDVLK